ncbi:MAG: LysR family transcriptional regulator ArgP [Pseudomonadota bacterium]
MRFDYPLLEALSAVVREGTFEAAARSLGITQSAVSQRVRLLEEKTGAILVKRGRPCVPTELGMKLYRHTELVQLLEHDLETSLVHMTAGKRNLPAAIRIAVNADSVAIWFTEVVRRAAGKLNVFFDIIPDDQEHTAQRLRDGEALAAVTTESRPIHGCKRVPLGAMAYVAVATPQFVADHFPDGVSLEAVSRAPIIFFDRKDTLQEQWLLTVFGRSVGMQCHYVPSFNGYLNACLAGCGFGLVPRPTVDEYIRAGAFTELTPGNSVEVSLYWQSSARESEMMRDLSQVVVDVARRYLNPP